MAPPPRWAKMVESSRLEALNAVEFYNRPASRRPLEAFLVHMHIAWLYLLHAQFVRNGIDYRYREPKNPRRYVRVDGEPKTWDLERCVRERWPSDMDPVRKNLEVTIRLRNRIEHRYEGGITVMAAGFTQALIMNYEEEVVSGFGVGYSIARDVHIPISLSTFSRDGVAGLVAAQAQLPKRLRDFFVGIRAGLAEDVIDDRRFEFRIDIIQKRAPKSDADLAVTFVREDELAPEERAAYEQLAQTGRVILRDKVRAVANLGLLRPKTAAAMVETEIPFRFSEYSEFPRAWKVLKVRPPSDTRGAARRITDTRYCCYDEAHEDYMYTRAFVDLLIERCSTAAGFEDLLGRRPRTK